MTYMPRYGVGDTTFRAAGGYHGIKKLVDVFYANMATNERYARIWDLHPPEITKSRDKLTRFLCGWMGGPRLFNQKYGPISIPGVHAHLKISKAERDQWLACMQEALTQQDYPEELQTYLFEQLSIPAELIRKRCEPNF